MPSLIPDAAAFERRLAGLPIVKHPASQVVLAARSKTGRLLFLSGAVEVIIDGEKIASVMAPGSVFGEQAEFYVADAQACSRLHEQAESLHQIHLRLTNGDALSAGIKCGFERS